MNTDPNYIESNPLIDRLPKHLKQFIKPQNYEDYSLIDQAVWRYVMRKNVAYLAQVAHPSYLDGLAQTGIEIDTIPSMYGMNRILKEIGWAAVAVDGFIPPNAFMEFQAYKVLVIASDIRTLEHIEYTPAPDIIHESAGHAPIIANPDYAEYLRRLGAIGSKAILSQYDLDLYEAVRSLSILKESRQATEEEIQSAEAKVLDLQAQSPPPSEMAQIRNLQWWTVEYGLIGSPEDFKIYGAGLLSSIGESQSCQSESVKKIPYSVLAAQQDFDITRTQPQLFVTPDFAYLMQVLEEFANGLSFRKGGPKGLKRLLESDMVGTIELSTGLQVSGNFNRALFDEEGQVIYFQCQGKSALAFREKELIGHGVERYATGFASPLGKLKNINLAIEDMGPNDLKAYNFYDGKRLAFAFESGIKVEGLNVTGLRNAQGKLMLIQLDDCTVTYGEEVLHAPEDGTFDMAVGQSIISAFAGAADPDSFPNLYQASDHKTVAKEVSNKDAQKEAIYAEAQALRKLEASKTEKLESLFLRAQKDFPLEWLLFLEFHETAEANDHQDLRLRIEAQLDWIKVERPGIAHLVDSRF